MAVEIREIKATDWIGEAWSLLVDHREELTTNKDLMILSPDVETYLRLEDLGRMLSLAAFEGEEIIGYSVNIFGQNLHYSDLMMCQNDVLFVRKDKRRGPTGLRLMRETERLAKERGAEMMLWHAKPGTSLDAILPRLGYKVQDIIYTTVMH